MHTGVFKTAKCTRCKQTKPADQFASNRHTTSGLHSHCRVCNSAVAKGQLRLKEQQRQNPEAPTTCSKCGESKPAAQFALSTKNCKECHKHWCAKYIAQQLETDVLFTVSVSQLL